MKKHLEKEGEVEENGGKLGRNHCTGGKRGKPKETGGNLWEKKQL